VVANAHHHGCLPERAPAAHPLQDVEAAAVGQLQVEDHAVEQAGLQRAQRVPHAGGDLLIHVRDRPEQRHDRGRLVDGLVRDHQQRPVATLHVGLETLERGLELTGLHR